MPGIPTKFIIAELVLERLASDKQLPPDLMDKANLPFFYLGAIGASFGDLISARPEIGAVNPNSAYFQDWLPILQMFAGTPGTPGVYRNLKKLRDILTALNNIINSAIKGNAAEKDLAKFALLDMLDEVNSLPDLNAALTDTINSLTTLRTTIGMNILKGGPSPKSGPKQSWQVRDTLHQSQTGRFLDTLYKTATNSQQRAYALGASVGYSADLCGNPYINSIVGGPYRNDWWRHRWISNYVDTWVYGFYRQGGAKAVFIDPANVRVPNPLYTNWPNVLEANLQAKIELPGLSPNSILDNIAAVQPVTGVLPQDFVDYWIQAYTTTYGSPDSRINTEGIQSAYAMTWLILWIQTSGDVFPCIPPDQVNYPDNCGSRPNWVPVDGSIAVNDGTVVHPPQPERDTVQVLRR